MAKSKKSKNAAGGKALATIKGYHSLLSKRSHNQISARKFKIKSAKLLAKLNRNDK